MCLSDGASPVMLHIIAKIRPYSCRVCDSWWIYRIKDGGSLAFLFVHIVHACQVTGEMGERRTIVIHENCIVILEDALIS